MTELPMIVVTVYEVNSFDFEKFVKAYYPDAKPYSFVADTECGNDSQHEYTVEKEELDKWDAEKVADFASGKWVSYVTQALLADLCNRDLIPAGTYIIKVSC